MRKSYISTLSSGRRGNEIEAELDTDSRYVFGKEGVRDKSGTTPRCAVQVLNGCRAESGVSAGGRCEIGYIITGLEL